MITLHLGVDDIPYSWGKKKATKTKNETTGDVAEILENKYHVMEVFFELHQGEIIAQLEDAINGALETALMGGPQSTDPHAAATTEIEALFASFLSNQEMDALGIPGVPTQAALKGVSHRFKHPYAKRPPRPSFIDTGLYENSMRAWVD